MTDRTQQPALDSHVLNGHLRGIIESLTAERDALQLLAIQHLTERNTAQARVAELEAGLRAVLDAADKGRMIERGVGGMTIEAQIRRSVYNGVPAWPFEEARDLLERKSS